MPHDLTRDLKIRQVRDALPFDGPTRKLFDELVPTSDQPVQVSDPVNMPEGEGWVEFLTYLRGICGEFIYLATHECLEIRDARAKVFMQGVIKALPQWLEKDVAWINMSGLTTQPKVVRRRMLEIQQEREAHLAKDSAKWQSNGPSAFLSGILKEVVSKLGIDLEHITTTHAGDKESLDEHLAKILAGLGPQAKVVTVNAQDLMSAADPEAFLADKLKKFVEDHQDECDCPKCTTRRELRNPRKKS